MMRTTRFPKPSDIERKWYLLDAKGKVLGRLASEIAQILRGKRKSLYAPNIDTGDHVVVINADKVVLTGNKEQKKAYYRHSGYPGGLKEIPYLKMKESRPEEMIIHAVKGMLPHNRLGRAMIKKLHVYSGSEHPHAAQKPEPIDLEG